MKSNRVLQIDRKKSVKEVNFRLQAALINEVAIEQLWRVMFSFAKNFINMLLESNLNRGVF